MTDITTNSAQEGLDSIRRGYLLHYCPDDNGVDSDQALLDGDRLYAEGLSIFAELGDTEVIEQLADLISLSAQVHAEGRPEVAETAWDTAAQALTIKFPPR